MRNIVTLTAMLILVCALISCTRIIDLVVPQDTATATIENPTQTETPEPTPDLQITPTSVWDAYTPSTIKEIIGEFEEEVGSVELGNMSIYPFPAFRVKMVFLDVCRDLQQGRIDLLTTWSKQFNPQNTTKLLRVHKHECLFKEGKNEFWLPIQEQLLPYLRQEVDKGEDVTLYIRWMGINREVKEIDWVFWIAEFQADNSSNSLPNS